MIGAASTGWAKKVFPDQPEETAVQLLWEEIFKTTRVNEENPVEAWKNMIKIFMKKWNT